MGRDALSSSIMWSAGNGEKINIREEKWLRSRATGGPANRGEPQKVADFDHSRQVKME